MGSCAKEPRPGLYTSCCADCAPQGCVRPALGASDTLHTTCTGQGSVNELVKPALRAGSIANRLAGAAGMQAGGIKALGRRLPEVGPRRRQRGSGCQPGTRACGASRSLQHGRVVHNAIRQAVFNTVVQGSGREVTLRIETILEAGPPPPKNACHSYGGVKARLCIRYNHEADDPRLCRLAGRRVTGVLLA